MMNFQEWCEYKEEEVDGHELKLLFLKNEKFETACKLAADKLPHHFASPERISNILERLGKHASAIYLRDKIPETASIRSGDLGEILATEYIAEFTSYFAPINRLRWKDHREMAMRGDDVIAVALNMDGMPIRFLKCESKSRASLATAVVEDARRALNGNDNKPSPHALAFVSDRLNEAGRTELADLILMAQLNDGISDGQVGHLLFIFCGNNPSNFLKADLEKYDGPIQQRSVGLQIINHQEFIATVYGKVEFANES